MMNYKRKIDACNSKIKLYKQELDRFISMLMNQAPTNLDLRYEITDRYEKINLLRDKIEDLQPWWRKLFKMYYYGS